jgi:hypothetical protein
MSVILFQGLVFTLVLWNSKIALAGTEGITFFVLTLFTLLNIKRKLVVVNKLYINAPLFTIAMVFIWLMTLYIHSLMSEDYKIIFTGLFSSIFGASIGLIAYLHIRFTNVINPKILSEALQEKRIKAIRQQLFSLAVIANEELKRVNRELIHNDEAVQDRHDYSEEKLNEILDKINDTGEKSLTDSEKEFLDGYANRI